MSKSHRIDAAKALALPALCAALVMAPVTLVSAQQPMPAASAASASKSASAAAAGNKATKPPVEAAASSAGVATKKPAKPGAQSGPTPASAPR
jgi:hypothetical protein